MKDYYLGLDCGTESVGWAVTDYKYELEKAKGKKLWGIRLFEGANTAEDRRMARSARRRTYRKKARIDLLDEFFEKEINKVDPHFFTRLNDSKYWLEDKTNKADKNSLFNDKKFKDKDYHRQYPTIFHLRAELIENPKPHDIRLVYLAIHHILKNRGHFVYEGQEISSVKDISPLLKELKQSFYDLDNQFEIQFPEGFDSFGKILSDKTINNKAKVLKDYIVISGEDNKTSKAITSQVIKALVGNKVSIEKLFPTSDIDFDNIENKDFSFSSSSYEEKEELIKSDIGLDYFGIINCLKLIYDWALLDNILHGKKYISQAKIDVYNIHKEELSSLKKLIKKYDAKKYDEVFLDVNDKLDNYVKYIGHGLSAQGKKDRGELKSNCTQEAINKYLKKVFDGIIQKNKTILKDDFEFASIYNKIVTIQLLPKAISGNNRVIPYQVNCLELEKILDNTSKYLPFLTKIDEEGFSIQNKIIAIMKFRIPYYVGPLVENNGTNKDYQKFSWMVRKDGSTGKILPWKFTEQVDLAECGDAFIKRMSRKCTYLPNENVLPKNSLLNCEFSLLNELNNLKINGEKPSVSTKNEIFKLFKQNKSVSLKKVKGLLISLGLFKKGDLIEFTGIDKKFNSSLKSYIDFKEILEEKLLTSEEIDEIIEWATVFSEGQDLLKNKIEDNYGLENGGKLTDANIKYILQKCKSYSGWGNLSKKFLTEMYDINSETGEVKNIITLMKETNYNLMELMSSKFTISSSVEEELSNSYSQNSDWTYESLVEPLLVSPSVKRSIWQTILIVKELRKVLKGDPNRIFIEMARGEKQKNKKRTISRKDSLIYNYKNITDNADATKILNSLENETNDSLRKEKLYLYYTQMGKCMYSNETISLNDLLSSNSRYDIDHIYPQKSVKDNSFDNKVLVKSIENGKKSDNYPLTNEVQKKCIAHWKNLLNNKLISKEKYNRLTRKSELSVDELEGFIARQIVETRQSTKAIAKILESMCPTTKVIFSKAMNVSDFRNQYCFHKARSVNDLHHAKDAYLNIVVGNAYYTKFTRNPSNFFKDGKYNYGNRVNNSGYNLGKLFNYDIIRNNRSAWISDSNLNNRINNNNDKEKYPETGTIVTVRKVMSKNNILFTRECLQRKGQLSNMNISKGGANKGVLPIKSKDKILLDTEKYGGYNNVSKAYFFIVEHTFKNKRKREFFDIPVYKAIEIEDGNYTLNEYCKNELSLQNYKVIVPKVLINTKFEKEGFIYEISGSSGDSLSLKPAVQLTLTSANYDYVYKLEKYLSKIKEFENFNKNCTYEEMINFSHTFESIYKINSIKNIFLFKELVEKLNKTIFRNRSTVNKLLDKLNNSLEAFEDANVIQQAKNIEQLLLIFQCKKVGCNQNWVAAFYPKVKSSDLYSTYRINKPVTNNGFATMQKTINKDITFIYQSVTGLYEKRRLIKA